jgi:carbon monoxide dehydrogenase subunit G
MGGVKGGSMTAVSESVEIARRPEDVFAYATDFARFPDWQSGVVSASPADSGPPRLGSTANVIRQAGPRRLARTEELTEFDPPRRWTVRGVGGPITAIASAAIEPLADGERSRLTITLDFEGRGIGKLLIPLVVRRQARRQLPVNERNLKMLLERTQ